MTTKRSKGFGLALVTSIIGLSLSPLNAGVEDGLIAYYPFEQGSLGTDATGNGHNLENHGVTSGDGVQGGGAVFDGFSSLDTSDVDGLVPDGDFTWSTWFIVEDEELSGGLLSLSPDAWAPGAKALFKGEENFLAFDVGWLGAAEYEEDFLDGEWHHATVVTRFDEEEELTFLELYIDGEWVSEIEGEPDAFETPEGSVFRVGSGSPGDPGLEEEGEPFPDPPTFSGTLDEVRIHNRALELEEIQEMVILGLGGLDAPEIVSAPAAITGIVGRSITLQVEAEGLFASYEWAKDGEVLEEQEEPTLMLEDLSSEDAGTYKVTVTNDAGSAEAEIQVTLLDAWSTDVNLIGLYTFESSDNLGKDDSGEGNDLDDFFAAQGDGIKGKGLSLDGLGRLEDTDGEFPFSSLADFTWTAFIKTEVEDTTLIAKSPGDDDEESPNTWAPGSKALFIREGELAFDTGWIGDVQSGDFIADNEWHHVAVSVDIQDGEDIVQLWVDGNPSGTWESDLQEQPDPGIFFIGYTSDDFPFDTDDNWFQGQMDQVRIYSQTLAPEDMITVFLEDGGSVIAPSITGHPSDTSVVEGRTARFSIEAAGTGLTYQWKKDGVEIDGAVNATLSVRGAQKDDAGSYSVTVTSPHSTPVIEIESNAAQLSIEDAPHFVGGELAHLGAFLEAYWNFDELNDDDLVPDLSPLGGHHGGLLNDAALTSGNEGYGGSGEALNAFDGEMPHMAAMNPEGFDFNNDFTWTARIFLFEPAPEGDEVGSGIFGRSPAETEHNPGSKILYVSGLNVGFDTGWVGAVNSEEILELETWHQLTMTYFQEENLISIWVDEEPVISDEGEEIVDFEFEVNTFPEDEEAGGGLVNSGFRIGGGANEFFSDPFPGLIDDVAIWSTVLSEDDIISLAEGVSPLPTVGEKPETPTIAIQRTETTLTITFEGQLQSSDNPNGPWEAVEESESPYTVDTTDTGKQFYRAVR